MATQVRRDVLTMVYNAQSGHPGGPMGCAELFTALYFSVLRHDPSAFDMQGRDQDVFFLSNGHLSAGWYSVLARSGYFPLEELSSFRMINSRLQGHPATEEGLPGVRIASGSLGQGLSAACGMALAKKLDGDSKLVYCLMGDGEMNEGQIWEAAQAGAHYGLDNLIGIVDINGAGSDGDPQQTLRSEPLKEKWEAFGWNDGGTPRPCAIHVDTGMNRLGLTPEEAHAFATDNALTGALTPRLVMSHLACGDDAGHPLNRRQRESFQAVSRLFDGIESSLSNSAGIFLGPDFAFDLARPGIALYGGQPFDGGDNPMRAVATLEARVVQVRRARAGETASYGAHGVLSRDTVIAVVSTGYADGYHRASSFAGVPLRRAVPAGGHGFVHGRRVPVLGRVTMDLTLFDVTDLGPDGVAVGDWIELFGPNVPVDEAAAAAGTISYEMLTSLGRRYHRRYVGGDG